MEKTLVTIGDDCTLNAGASSSATRRRTATFKSDRIAIGAGCTLGVGAFVHYGVTMGDGAVLAPDSFLMKGEDIPAHARWGGNPAGRSATRARRGGGDERRSTDEHDDAVPAGSTGAACWSPAASPRSRGGPSTRSPASPSTRRRSPTTSRPRCAGWRTSSGCRSSSVLLAAHAKVLAALTGEREVATGYVAAPGGGRCRAG